jgi:hypothetical protein
MTRPKYSTVAAFGVLDLEIVALGEAVHGFAELGVLGEESAELSELSGVAAVLEGVEVAPGGTGAGAAAAALLLPALS